MTPFRLEPARLREAVVPTLPPGATEPDDAAVAARFAAGAWTVLPEPGDGAAGIVRERLGPVRALQLLVEGASAADWGRELDDADDRRAVADALGRWQPRLAAERILAAFSQGAAFGQRLVTRDDVHWPAGLDELGPHAPAAVWVRGDPAALSACARSTALVGSRASSGYGELVTAQLASGLVARGFAVVSGGAYGIDGAAHRAALAAGGTTVAVLAGGLDRFYPAGHDELLRRVASSGCVIAEAPSGVPPTRWRFLARNRLIAALASATVVVEAGQRSGSINTAGHAAALGRPLGAVPGPVTSGSSTGCHRLLREYGAAVVERAEHVVEMLDGPGEEQHALGGMTSDELRVLDALSARAPRGVDELAVRTGMARGDVVASLALLELGARALERASGWVRAAQQGSG
ncbi:DNA-processing protein DprA [Agrococcus sp. SCSIO52902]|uniref:DNA-processing protein DprA n=1 Tax=Agrococcus sp. SCSIO52902 TaxID=2933290 RepID=UPI001FF48752|nr:DNA-processing protein DprA [Agrococcus sp. SCSIO52902]UOW00741.1 DNA-processing protein DprA [Agrococcus sp. SCSIO52902]